MRTILFIGLLSLVAVYDASAKIKEGECEVCIKVIGEFSKSLSNDDLKSHKTVEEKFKKFCKSTKSKANRLCYYLGGLKESATGILTEMSKPITNHFPTEIICEKLMKKDSQICDLRYEKQIDLNTIDLNKQKVKDLKKILSNWDESCDGCIEKSEYIKRIEELKHKYSTKTEL